MRDFRMWTLLLCVVTLVSLLLVFPASAQNASDGPQCYPAAKCATIPPPSTVPPCDDCATPPPPVDLPPTGVGVDVLLVLASSLAMIVAGVGVVVATRATRR